MEWSSKEQENKKRAPWQKVDDMILKMKLEYHVVILSPWMFLHPKPQSTLPENRLPFRIRLVPRAGFRRKLGDEGRKTDGSNLLDFDSFWNSKPWLLRGNVGTLLNYCIYNIYTFSVSDDFQSRSSAAASAKAANFNIAVSQLRNLVTRRLTLVYAGLQRSRPVKSQGLPNVSGGRGNPLFRKHIKLPCNWTNFCVYSSVKISTLTQPPSLQYNPLTPAKKNSLSSSFLPTGHD